jgi:hypothetical protein
VETPHASSAVVVDRLHSPRRKNGLLPLLMNRNLLSTQSLGIKNGTSPSWNSTTGRIDCGWSARRSVRDRPGLRSQGQMRAIPACPQVLTETAARIWSFEATKWELGATADVDHIHYGDEGLRRNLNTSFVSMLRLPVECSPRPLWVKIGHALGPGDALGRQIVLAAGEAMGEQRGGDRLAVGSSSNAATFCPRELAKSTRSTGIGTSRGWKVILA